MLRVAAIVCCLTAACGGGAENESVDAGDSSIDAAREPDAGGEALFVVDGPCDVLDDELTDAQPADFSFTVTFDHEWTSADEALLSEGGAEILADGNSGGSSTFSEIFAFEIISGCEGAMLVKTETEIDYVGQSVRTDFSTNIDATRIGVSVTRAQTFPLGTDMTEDRARELLEDKLGDILVSSANVVPADGWQKQILAVMVYNQQHHDVLQTALTQIDAPTRADSVVWFSVTEGADNFIYTE